MQTPEAISALEAWQKLQSADNVVLVDIRSNMEYMFVGHPLGAELVPWIDDPDWTINPEFVEDMKLTVLPAEVEALDDERCPEIILICRSGNRSLDAGKVLLEAGFRHVMHIEEGFEGDLNEARQRGKINGWRHQGLPWEQC